MAEDYAQRRISRSQHWRLVPDHYPDIHLRYQPDAERRSIMPEARADATIGDDQPLTWSESQRALVNCPRCGADNRNWLRLLSLSPPSRFLGKLRFWLQKFPLAIFGLLVTGLVLLRVIWRYYENGNLGQNLTLFIVVLLAGWLITDEVTRRWHSLREYKHSRGYIEPRSFFDQLSPPLATGLVMFLIFVFLIPFIIYVALPRGFDFAAAIIAPESPPDQAEQISHVRDSARRVIAGGVADTEPLEHALTKLHAYLEIPPAEDQPVAQRVHDALTRARNFVRDQPNNELTPLIMAEVERIRVHLNIPEERGPGIDTDFLKTWVRYVGFVSAIVIYASLAAVEKYVGRVSSVLPQPIFHSIAQMTRVVVWETKRSLEIPGDMSHIQWTNVERNARGGITLSGVHRDTNQPDQRDNPGYRLSAQVYTIDTDRWGRITSANISDRRVPQPPELPGVAIGRKFFEQVPVPPQPSVTVPNR